MNIPHFPLFRHNYTLKDIIPCLVQLSNRKNSNDFIKINAAFFITFRLDVKHPAFS